MRSIVEAIGRKLGIRLVPEWKMRRLPVAELHRDIIESMEVDLVVDVGANAGQYVDFLRWEVGYDGHVASFDPLEENFSILSDRSAEDDAWQVFQLALGSEPGTKEFRQARSNTFSSFLAPHENVDNRFSESVETVDIQMVRVDRLDALLDDICASTGTSRVFLKSDTQGFDLEVLKGTSDVLNRIVAVQIEVAVQPIYEHMPSFRTAIDTLEDLGFRLAGFFPVSADEHSRAYEFDCIAVAGRGETTES